MIYKISPTPSLLKRGEKRQKCHIHLCEGLWFLLTGEVRKNIFCIMLNGKKFLGPVFIGLLLCFLSACDRPQITGMDFDQIDVSRDPIQGSPSSKDPIIIEMENYRFTLTPLAEYRLSGMVVSRETYSDDWNAKVSPFDLAIVWGKLTEPEYDRYMTYDQSNRWYFYRWKADKPFDDSYVISHSSNNHIIPGNKNIEIAINAIRRKEKVTLEGALVNLAGTVKGEKVTWNTSLSRKDTGDGSCELFYVTKVRIDTKVYE